MNLDDLDKELGLISHNDTPISDAGGWSVPWSDLMMVMFVLFVVLFIYSQSKKDIKVIFAGNSDIPVASTPMEGLVNMITYHRDAVSKQSKTVLLPQDSLYRSGDGAVTMKEEDEGDIKIVMRGDAFFAPGKSILQPKTLKYLKEIASVLKTSKHMVHIIGHADKEDMKISSKGFELASMRASNVANFLIKQKSIDPVRVMVSSRGSVAPELPSAIEKVSGNNRRVEIIVINELDQARGL